MQGLEQIIDRNTRAVCKAHGHNTSVGAQLACPICRTWLSPDQRKVEDTYDRMARAEEPSTFMPHVQSALEAVGV